MLLICPGLGTGKAPSPSTLHSCHLFIVSVCRHLAILISSPHHLFFEDCLHQSSTSSSLPLQPQTDQSVQETSTSFTPLIRNPSLCWSAVGASRDFVYHSSKLRADQKSQSLILGSSEVGKLGSVDGTASVWQLQRWGRVASWHRERGGAHKPLLGPPTTRQRKSRVVPASPHGDDAYKMSYWVEIYDWFFILIYRWPFLLQSDTIVIAWENPDKEPGIEEEFDIDGKYCEKMLE